MWKRALSYAVSVTLFSYLGLAVLHVISAFLASSLACYYVPFITRSMFTCATELTTDMLKSHYSMATTAEFMFWLFTSTCVFLGGSLYLGVRAQ